MDGRVRMVCNGSPPQDGRTLAVEVPAYPEELLSPEGARPRGPRTGVGAFANSSATLGAIGVYDPIWTYDLETLSDDLSSRVVFGLVTSTVYRVLTLTD